MHPLNPEFDLPKLRQQLEEILAIVNGDGVAFIRGEDDGNTLPVHASAGYADPGVPSINASPASPTACELVSLEDAQPDKRDDLYYDALVVATEFGQASPTILQMWLSIDYGRAIAILNQFQAEGLISSKGRVRHKAFSLLRSLEQHT
jgi:DNA segregation ATPase FtsK/SpoIIIE-like protein